MAVDSSESRRILSKPTDIGMHDRGSTRRSQKYKVIRYKNFTLQTALKKKQLPFVFLISAI